MYQEELCTHEEVEGCGFGESGALFGVVRVFGLGCHGRACDRRDHSQTSYDTQTQPHPPMKLPPELAFCKRYNKAKHQHDSNPD